MADFAKFAHDVGPCFGFDADAVENVLRGMGDIQRGFSAEDEPLIDLVDRWLTPKNSGRWISTSELFTELQEVAQPYHGTSPLPFDFKNPRALGQRISDMRGTLEHLFGFEERKGRSNKRFVVFQRREDETQAV